MTPEQQLEQIGTPNLDNARVEILEAQVARLEKANANISEQASDWKQRAKAAQSELERLTAQLADIQAKHSQLQTMAKEAIPLPARGRSVIIVHRFKVKGEVSVVEGTREEAALLAAGYTIRQETTERKHNSEFCEQIVILDAPTNSGGNSNGAPKTVKGKIVESAASFQDVLENMDKLDLDADDLMQVSQLEVEKAGEKAAGEYREAAKSSRLGKLIYSTARSHAIDTMMLPVGGTPHA